MPQRRSQRTQRTNDKCPHQRYFLEKLLTLIGMETLLPRKYVRTYNEIILNAAKKLRSIDERQVAEIARGGSRIIAPQTRKRLRAIIKQSSDSLDTWWARSALKI